MSATHVAVIFCMRTGLAYKEESMKTDYPDARNEYSTVTDRFSFFLSNQRLDYILSYRM